MRQAVAGMPLCVGRDNVSRLPGTVEIDTSRCGIRSHWESPPARADIGAELSWWARPKKAITAPLAFSGLCWSAVNRRSGVKEAGVNGVERTKGQIEKRSAWKRLARLSGSGRHRPCAGQPRWGNRVKAARDRTGTRVVIFVIDAIGVGAASGKGGKVVVQHVAVFTPPCTSAILEIAHQLLLLRIHADYRPSP